MRKSLAAIGAIALILPSFAQSQGLAEAARKEQERRKKNAAAGARTKSVSDDDLKSASAGRGTYNAPDAPPSSATTAPADPTEPSPRSTDRGQMSGSAGAELADRQRKIDYWRGVYGDAKADVARAEAEVAGLEQRASRIGAIVKVWDPYGPPTDPKIRHEAEAVLDQLRDARSRLTAAKERLPQIEAAARKDGVLPGQL